MAQSPIGLLLKGSTVTIKLGIRGALLVMGAFVSLLLAFR